MIVWNPWHGCKKYSEGCEFCYVYRRDESIGKDSSVVTKNLAFNLPLKKNRQKEYKIPAGSVVYTCMTSDFFIEDADEWRGEIWEIIKKRSDLSFIIITKRIVRFMDCIPNDWGEGYPNVEIVCTIENQKACDVRFPVLKEIPAKKRSVAAAPLLGAIDMEKYLFPELEVVSVGGESGLDARLCDYNWILDIRRQCINKGVRFLFHQTGARLKKDGRIYNIPRNLQHKQAKKANINT